MQRQKIDPIAYPLPSFSKAVRQIQELACAGGEFSDYQLRKLTSIDDHRMLFEAASWAADQLPGSAHFVCRRLAGTWWRSWILVVRPAAEVLH